jgi:hypothetical protein
MIEPYLSTVFQSNTSIDPVLYNIPLEGYFVFTISQTVHALNPIHVWKDSFL